MSKRHDVTVLKKKFLRKRKVLKEIHKLKFEFLAGDAAYDDYDVHWFVENELEAKSLIKVRAIKGSIRSKLRRKVLER